MKRIIIALLCAALLCCILPISIFADTHTHTPGELRCNDVGHYRLCTTCGEQLDPQSHYGGKATCVEKGKCAVCGYAYLPENEDHIPETKWTACAGLYHAHLCILCGAHCDPEGHIPGPAATESTPQTCTVCGYIMAPVKEHTHKLILVGEVAPTCTQAGVNAYYRCEGCQDLFLDEAAKQKIGSDIELVLPPLGHILSNAHGFDAQQHWYLCVICAGPMPETGQPHDLQNGKCDLCGFEAPPPTESTAPPTAGTVPTIAPTEPTEPAIQSDSPIWLIPTAIGILLFAAATITTVLIAKRKK